MMEQVVGARKPVEIWDAVLDACPFCGSLAKHDISIIASAPAYMNDSVAAIKSAFQNRAITETNLPLIGDQLATMIQIVQDNCPKRARNVRYWLIESEPGMWSDDVVLDVFSKISHA